MKIQIRRGQNPLTLSITEAGQLAGISRTVAYQLAAAGIIPTVVIPGTKSRKVPIVRFYEWLRSAGIPVPDGKEVTAR